MCQIICNITHSCGHIEPWVGARACQFDAWERRKPEEKDPFCLLYGHCAEFGKVRQISLSDETLCSDCFIDYVDARKDIDEIARIIQIDRVRKSADSHALTAQSYITNSALRSRLEDLPTRYVRKVTRVALKRLNIAFSDAQMEPYHFEELFQIIVGLPSIRTDLLVQKFAYKIEEKFVMEVVKHIYEFSMRFGDFGDEFRKGLTRANVIRRLQRDEEAG
ncbi:hypothetical protein F5B17DRAFT_452564 [Nemania serpens]|nr:hypothetical protein F5B17DRAFT_452564 [Nemania serpens]